ncbi:dihydroorotate dehydrogenase [Brevibacillus choshinensis]|uniref:dihydroorotate dehydrogenase n=1 Tax=Brevibacillus choshinensis TaxID=54911 RepID=UPI002E22414D|nr:dihydroorotate dehydrogenase [Brevibacillus choshinensis]
MKIKVRGEVSVPDWSYQTLFRPLFFLLSPERARDITLSAIGTLAKYPGGTFIIELMGHMKPPHELSRSVAGITFPTSVGLGAGLDPHATAIKALSRFGVGFIELGPVTIDPILSGKELTRNTQDQTIIYPEMEGLANPGMHSLLKQLRSMGTLAVPIGARLACRPDATWREATDEILSLVNSLTDTCSFFSIDTRWFSSISWSEAEWRLHLQEIRAATESSLFLLLSPDCSKPEAMKLFQPAWEEGYEGVLVAGGICNDRILQDHASRTWLTGPPTHEQSRRLVQWLREHWPTSFIIGSGGIHEPADALHMLSAGADLVQLHSGLVYSGPGLPKRINEAILQTSTEAHTDSPGLALEHPKNLLFPAWIWGMILGIGMMIGGTLAWIIAATRVVLPYDERFLGMSVTELMVINERLLPFMSHDRISLAGTMISIGVIYYQLSRNGLRYGHHAARKILLISGSIGFSSFFLFLGYGYFDYLHAILAILLLPTFLLALRASCHIHLPILPAQLRNDRDWRQALWGQLFFVIIGVGLTAAGIMISLIGVTGVFVPSDLIFLCAAPEVLQTYNERLIPLIAHDRAGFGGALVSDGIAVLLLSLWGFRRGESWLWWTLLLAGVPGFVAGIGVHFFVGYVDFIHLLPAFVAMVLFLLGLVLSRPYLTARHSSI